MIETTGEAEIKQMITHPFRMGKKPKIRLLFDEDIQRVVIAVAFIGK